MTIRRSQLSLAACGAALASVLGAWTAWAADVPVVTQVNRGDYIFDSLFSVLLLAMIEHGRRWVGEATEQEARDIVLILGFV